MRPQTVLPVSDDFNDDHPNDDDARDAESEASDRSDLEQAMYDSLRSPRPRGPGCGVRVLVVDDNEVDRQLISRLLRRRFEDARIEFAETARESLAEARRHPPDVMVLANQLSDGEAIDVLARLSVARGMTLCPVIVVTTHPDIALAVRLLRMGAADYIWKEQLEVDPENAAAVLERSINHAREQHRLARRAALYRANTLLKRRRERVALDEAERQRRDAEIARERLRLAIDGAGLGTWDWHPATGEVGHNDLLLTMLGYEPDELVFSYATWRSMVHPEDLDRTLAALEAHMEGRSTEFRAECRLQTKEGGWKWVLTSGGVVQWDEQGRPLRVTGVHLDIDERKRGDLALIEAKNYTEHAQQQLIDTLTSISDAFLTIDRDWQFTYVNPQAERLLRKPSSELIGRNLFQAFPDLREGPLAPAMITAMEQRKSAAVVAHFADVDRWVDARFYPSAEGISLFLLDVTDFHEQQEKLRESERLANRRLAEIESIYQSAAVGLAFIDRDYKYVSANETLATMHGLTPSELIGKPVEAILGAKLFARLRPHYDSVLREGRQEEAEVELKSRRGGIPRAYLVRYTPVVGPGGRVDGINIVASDITDRKRHEKRLQAAMRHADAARVSAERAKELAERANRAKSEFLAVLSHELRTPLTPVLAGTQLLHEELTAASGDALSEDAREMLAMVRRNVELEVRLIDDLLDLTRITRGKLQLNRKNVDLNDSVRHVCDACASDPPAPKPEIHCDLRAERSIVLADPARLQQVLWNLVKNAIKFTDPQGKIEIRTFNEPGADGEMRVVCEVEDTGVGIDPDVLPTIFTAFEQGGENVTRTFGGLGLGLAITHALVEAHHGKITARSEGRNRGSVFRVALPVSSGHPRAPRKSAAPVEELAGERRVLLVEDHRDTSKLMSRFLERRLGLAVTTAETVAAARDTLADASSLEGFDLIISDIGLPDGTGVELIREVMRLRDPLPPAVALSGYGTEQDVQNSLDAGFSAHLTKPVDLDLLEKTVRRLLGDKPN